MWPELNPIERVWPELNPIERVWPELNPIERVWPELNPIERVWSELKRFTKAHCKYSLPSLRKNIPLAYDSVVLDNIRNHFHKVRHFMFGYLEGLTPGKELDEALKKYKI